MRSYRLLFSGLQTLSFQLEMLVGLTLIIELEPCVKVKIMFFGSFVAAASCIFTTKDHSDSQDGVPVSSISSYYRHVYIFLILDNPSIHSFDKKDP